LHATPESARRTRGRIEAVLDWAKARGLRDGENPARWSGHLDHLLPARNKIVKHHAAIPYRELPAFMAGLRLRSDVVARALEFCILVAARTGEVVGSQWTEIDLEAQVWTLPPDRMKAGREHRVPLSARAIEILAGLPRDGDFIFGGARAGRPIGANTLLEIVRDVHGESATVHGFRSSFRDWAGNETNFPRELAEHALAHVIGDKAEQAYRRSDALARRRKLMEAWASYCAKAPAKREMNVTPMRARLMAAAAGDYVSLTGLASRWGAEAEVEADALAKAILDAFAGNEFDGLSIAEPLILVDPPNLLEFAVSKEEAKSLTAPYVTLEGRRIEASMEYIAWVRTGYVQVHLGVLPTFAKAHGLSMPRWLQASAKGDEAAKKGGRPDKYAWAKIEAALQGECRLQESIPRPDHSDKDWRTQADAVRFLQEHFVGEWREGGPGESTLRKRVSEVLKRIDERLKPETNSG
jgi:hypothetical protein